MIEIRGTISTEHQYLVLVPFIGSNYTIGFYEPADSTLTLFARYSHRLADAIKALAKHNKREPQQIIQVKYSI